MEFFVENMVDKFLNKGVASPFISSIFKGMSVVYIKDMEVECKACNRKMKKWQWNRHTGGKEHKGNMQTGNFDVDTVCVAIEDEKERKKCRKCRCYKALELYRGENETCNLCLDSRKRWAEKNPEKVKEMNQIYWDRMKEKKKKHNKENSSVNVECKICGCWVKKSNWARHEKTNKHILGVNGGKVDGGDG